MTKHDAKARNVLYAKKNATKKGTLEYDSSESGRRKLRILPTPKRHRSWRTKNWKIRNFTVPLIL